MQTNKQGKNQTKDLLVHSFNHFNIKHNFLQHQYFCYEYKNRKEFELPCHNHNAVKLVLKTRIKIDLQNIFKQTKFKHCFLSIFKISVIIRDAWMLTH